MDYEIIERGTRENGGTWARFTYGPDKEVGEIEVLPGGNLERSIEAVIRQHENMLAEIAKLPRKQRRMARRGGMTVSVVKR